jgi:hypothetical protein
LADAQIWGCGIAPKNGTHPSDVAGSLWALILGEQINPFIQTRIQIRNTNLLGFHF